MKRWLAILALAAAGLLAACSPTTNSPGASVESLAPIQSFPAVSAAPASAPPASIGASPSTAP